MDPIVAYPLSRIQRDTRIQTRTSIDMEHVGAIAEAMDAGREVPPVVLFGTSERAWIGDGWHRVTACDGMGAKSVCAVLREGGRAEALKFALGANASHGLKRTNADKRRCVELAVAEFPSLSSRQIAELCGVDPQTVLNIRGNDVSKIDTSHRVDSIGRMQPARKPSVAPAPEPRATSPVEAGGDSASKAAPLPDFDAKDDGFPAPAPAAGAPKRIWEHGWLGDVPPAPKAKPATAQAPMIIDLPADPDDAEQEPTDEQLDEIRAEGESHAAQGGESKDNPYFKLKMHLEKIRAWNEGFVYWRKIMTATDTIAELLSSSFMPDDMEQAWDDIQQQVSRGFEVEEEGT